jgi:hypothetical protein
MTRPRSLGQRRTMRLNFRTELTALSKCIVHPSRPQNDFVHYHHAHQARTLHFLRLTHRDTCVCFAIAWITSPYFTLHSDGVFRDLGFGFHAHARYDIILLLLGEEGRDLRT